MSPQIQVRVGIARFHDGWNVVVRCDGKTTIYDPTFATEAEAEAKAREAADAIRAAGSAPEREPT